MILARVQTNFRLRPEGGYLALVGSGTNVVSDFGAGYPKQSPGVSYGRMPGEPQVSGYFPHPTPGKPTKAAGGALPRVCSSHAGVARLYRPFLSNFPAAPPMRSFATHWTGNCQQGTLHFIENRSWLPTPAMFGPERS